MQKLVRSVREFPEMLQARPIVVDKDMNVLGGNMRLRACIIAGIKEVPIYIATWGEENDERFMITDNAHNGLWDWDILGNTHEPEKLQEWGVPVPFTQPTEEQPKEPKQCKHCEKIIP